MNLEGIAKAVITIIVIATPIFLFCYYSSCRKAEIFNEKYGTEYTCGDFLWAGNQINRQIQTIKVEGIK